MHLCNMCVSYPLSLISVDCINAKKKGIHKSGVVQYVSATAGAGESLQQSETLTPTFVLFNDLVNHSDARVPFYHFAIYNKQKNFVLPYIHFHYWLIFNLPSNFIYNECLNECS